MAFNIFQGTKDIIAGGEAAAERGWNGVDAIYKARAGRQAGRALASGDRQGAMDALGGEGQVDAVRTLQNDADADRQQAYANQRQGRMDQQATASKESERKVGVLKDVANGLKQVPAGQRMQALQHAMPLFEHVGVDPSIFGQLTEDQLTDAALDMFSGEIDKQYQQMFQNEGGIYGARSDGTVDQLQEFEPKERVLSQGQTLIGRDRKPVYTAPKTYAPPRARAGGGGKAAAPAPRATGRTF